MRKIKYTLDIGYCGCQEEDTMVIPDDMTDNEIDTMLDEMVHQYADSWEGDSRLGFDPDASEEEQEDHAHSFREGLSGYWEEVADDYEL
jgi:hypothetical protein